MIFVDTNVFMYAVGRTHPLRSRARAFFERAVSRRDPLCTSAEVLQELLHAYLPVGRAQTLDAALALCDAVLLDVWPIEREDVQLARTLWTGRPDLSARDLLHVATCRRRGATRLQTFDRSLDRAFRQLHE